MNSQKTFEVVDAAFETFVDLLKKVGAYNSGDGFGWHFPRYRAYAKALFDLSPIKRGARVRLTKTPEINAEVRWGWLRAKHFLVKGAMATVQDVDFGDGKFSAGLLFDDDSWVQDFGAPHERGVVHPVPLKERGQFWFSETSFEVVEEAP